MQHRLHKVLSSYTFSSAALDQLGGEHPGEDGEEEEAWQQRQRQQRSSRHGSTGSLGVERAPP